MHMGSNMGAKQMGTAFSKRQEVQNQAHYDVQYQ